MLQRHAFAFFKLYKFQWKLDFKPFWEVAAYELSSIADVSGNPLLQKESQISDLD